MTEDEIDASGAPHSGIRPDKTTACNKDRVGLREKYARIIDPEAYFDFDAANNPNVEIDEDVRNFLRNACTPRISGALTKAQDILSLVNPQEKGPQK